ncbi:MAG: hypothetical protein RLZZ216_1454 [Cyanobacteriota bacterium]
MIRDGCDEPLGAVCNQRQASFGADRLERFQLTGLPVLLHGDPGAERAAASAPRLLFQELAQVGRREDRATLFKIQDYGLCFQTEHGGGGGISGMGRLGACCA